MDDLSINGYDENAFPYSSYQEYESNSGERGCNLTLLSYGDNCTLGRNLTDVPPEVPRHFAVRVIIGVILTLIILATIIGNVFVLAAIWMERNLHSVANYLILSLAVADLMVACLVMPLGAVYEESGCARLGPVQMFYHVQEDLLIHGNSVYDIIDKADHGTVQTELLRGVGSSSTPSQNPNQPGEETRIFLCRMNVSRNARRQMRFGDQKVVLLQGRYLSYLPLCSRNEPVFVATCTPVAMPETRECVVQGATNVFTTIHAMDMKFLSIDRNAEYYLGYTRSELGGISWYQLIHWNYMREAQSKHRLISQSEQEKSCILLLRLQTRSGSWIWVHCVLQVKDASDSSSSSSSSSSAQQQQQSQQPSQQSVIVATNQILSEREAGVMRANSWLYHYYTVQTKLQYGLAYPEAVAASQGSPTAAATAARLAAAAYFPTPQLMNYTGHHSHLHHPHHHHHHMHHAQLTSAAEASAGGYAAAAMAVAAANAASMPPPLHSPAHNGTGTASGGAYGAATAQSGYLHHPHHPPTSHHPHQQHSPFEMSAAGKDSPLDFSLAASTLPFDYQVSAASSYGAAAAYWSHHHHDSTSSHGYTSATAPPAGSAGSGGTIGSQRSTGSEGSPSNSSTVSASATSPQTWSLQQNPILTSSTNNNAPTSAMQQQSTVTGKVAGSATGGSTTPRKRAKKDSIVASQSTPITESVSSSPPSKPNGERSSRSSGQTLPLERGDIIGSRGGNGSTADCSVATLATPFPYHNRYRNAYKLFGSSTVSSSDDDQAQVKEENITMSCPLTPSPVWEGQTHRVPDLQFYNVERDTITTGHHPGVMTGTDLIHCVPTYQPYLSYCTPPGTMASVTHHHPHHTFSNGGSNGASLTSTGFAGLPMGLASNGLGLHHTVETSLSESGSPNKENRLPPTPESSDHGESEENRPVKWESL